MGLKEYQKKRDFSQTQEPAGRVREPARGKAKSPLTFIVQKHAARRLHYDFRLELDGVLKSWAVPKGPPFARGEKRLAMHVEDHPLDYGAFEGVIPEGNYGAGTVMLWDRGTYEIVDRGESQGLREGKLHFILSGKKLKGEWYLVRIAGRGGDQDPWLLIKGGSDLPPISTRRDDQSVLTGHTMKQIAANRTRTWQSNRTNEKETSAKARSGAGAQARAKPPAAAMARRTHARPAKRKSGTKPKPAARQAAARPARRGSDAGFESITGALPIEKPRFVLPMKAKLVEGPPRDGEWWYEIKWDGYRVLAVKHAGAVELYSRSARKLTGDFSLITQAIADLPQADLVLDGEIVALDANGRPSFQLLQNYRQHLPGGKPRLLCCYLFDLLNLEGRDCKSLPLRQRRLLLEGVMAEAGDPLRFSGTLTGPAGQLLAAAQKNGLEGLIAKRPDSLYHPGQRSAAWLKVKCVNEQEFVIGGYTPPQGSRSRFGAILVGYYQGDQLIFASKVGTGFSVALLQSLYRQFQPLRRDAPPFADLDPRRTAASTHGLSRAEMRRCTWLEPKLVAQIRFTEWTADGGLRHPVFIALRDDKRPAEVVREKA